MGNRIYIYSTLSADQFYKTEDASIEAGGVMVKGKANIQTEHMLTPKGVVTQVTEVELAALENNRVFQNHKKNGFIVVDTAQKDPETVAKADMEAKDKSAQPTEDDYKKSGKKADIKKD